MNHHSCHCTHASKVCEDSTVTVIKSYHDRNPKPCCYRQSLSETADIAAAVLVVMFKRLERMQWKRSA